MIKVTAVYRWREGATFNHDYYHSEHMRIARAALQPLGLVRLEACLLLRAQSSSDSPRNPPL